MRHAICPYLERSQRRGLDHQPTLNKCHVRCVVDKKLNVEAEDVPFLLARMQVVQGRSAEREASGQAQVNRVTWGQPSFSFKLLLVT